ncbi:conserved hypothetical protein [Histoplasma capsulatum H143]|uniref:Zn(2)-C6 fungal-type domain-containing protein n=1 Tax=Ajellomyces capsulatus (strain H143) TaxID=544712 RepID=C6HKR4_AJECH|nr:conserved hypothetical protein [Histoplasma capsulatum H143]
MLPIINKSCDQCRRRKVRCILPQIPVAPSEPPACIHCINRNESCNFSPIRRNLRARSQKAAVPPREPFQEREEELLIDSLLRKGSQQNRQVLLYDETAVIKARNNRVTSSAISFYSSQRMRILTERLEADGFRELVDYMENLMSKEICVKRDSNFTIINIDKPPETIMVTAAEADTYIKAYFENLHPLYPFLDRQEFSSHVLELRTQDTENTNKALSALYHAVLALGSQYHNNGSFVLGSGKSWGLFQICLGHLPDLIVPAYSLVKLQALTAMSIFAMNVSCIKLDQTLIYEAARVAQYLRYHKSCHAQESHLRLFWTIYYIEKMTAFYESNSSVIADEDIGCVVPAVPESTIGGYDWFLSAIHLGRLCSMTYTSLFSTQAILKTKASLLASIKRIKNKLEQWRLSVPMAYRPREALQLSKFERPSTKWIVIQAQYLYYNLVFAVERLFLHVDSEDDADTSPNQRNLMDAAQRVVELVPFIDLAPHMPIL